MFVQLLQEHRWGQAPLAQPQARWNLAGAGGGMGAWLPIHQKRTVDFSSVAFKAKRKATEERSEARMNTLITYGEQTGPMIFRKQASEVTQSCRILCDPMNCSLPGSSTHGIFQARVLEWGAIAFSSQHSLDHGKSKAIPKKKKIYFCFIDYTKSFDCITTNCGKLFKGREYQTCLLRNLYASQEET